MGNIIPFFKCLRKTKSAKCFITVQCAVRQMTLS
jgi:hypothetical protein